MWCATLHAQQRPQDQTSAPLYPSTYETDPAADPARPTVTNPAHIPPPGYLQFEQGLLQANTTPGGGPDSQLSLVQVTKIALTHHIMPFVMTEPYAHSTTAGAGANDAGDLDAGVQLVLLDEGEGHSRIPTVAVAYMRRVRSGTSPNLDVGELSQSALFLASGNLPLGLHYDSNLLFNDQPGTGYSFVGTGSGTLAVPHDVRRLQFGQTISMTHNLIGKLAFTGEIWRFAQPYPGGSAAGNLNTLGYTVNKRLVLDAGFSKGLTGTSTHWETFVGATYLLPQRLWPLKSGPQ